MLGVVDLIMFLLEVVRAACRRRGGLVLENALLPHQLAVLWGTKMQFQIAG